MPEGLSCDLAALLVRPPKNLQLNGKVTTCSIAAAFYQGMIDCDNPTRTAPLSAYLQAEGPRRIPAFVFERLFTHRMRSTHEVSDNWYVCGGTKAKAPPIWFKLMDAAGDLSALDDVFSRLLRESGVPVWKAWFEGTQLWLSEARSQKPAFSAKRFIEENPCDMATRRGSVRNMVTDGKVPPVALRMLEQAGTAANDDLIRSRIFINCFLELTGGRPFDVDAICRRGDCIFAAELKRKYPSKGRFFGLDMHLTKLPRMLGGLCPVYHFVLEEMRGKASKSGDPTSSLMDAFNEGTNYRWHVLQLLPSFERTYTHRLQTTGRDSGQRGGNREQVGVPIGEFAQLSAPEAFRLTERR